MEKKDRDILLLTKENKRLLACLSQYEKPVKVSHNSSIPPSKESIPSRAIRRTLSLREKSGRPNGGQHGHKGVTLQQIPVPEETIHHCPDYCQCFGGFRNDSGAGRFTQLLSIADTSKKMECQGSKPWDSLPKGNNDITLCVSKNR